ncbi:hypothetical protein PTKIN_Ptkin04bG0097800 [Pterospermum kingtungense]
MEGCKSIAAGMNAMDLRRGITMAVDAVVINLKSCARMISTSEEIAQVGTISANGEREIGELIAKAMEKVGKERVITIQELDDLLILIYEKKISSLNVVVKVLELALKKVKHLQHSFLTSFVLDQAPGFGENRKNSLHDLAVLTRGEVRQLSAMWDCLVYSIE